MSLIANTRSRFQRLIGRRHYDPSAAPVYYLPDGFAIHRVGDTGIKIIDNFCTPQETRHLIDKARGQLTKSQIIVGGKAVDSAGRSSNHSVVFHRFHQDKKILPIIARGAMLAGVPITHSEQIYVTRYTEGELYNAHHDYADSFLADHRLCTILIYLNGLEEGQGGETYFRDLNVAVRPTLGRAVCWTNTNPDGSIHPETRHAALPPKGDAEKWVIQMWFRPYKMLPLRHEMPRPESGFGIPLTGTEPLPEGVSISRAGKQA